MKYFTTTSKASRRAVDCVIVGVYQRGKLGVGAADIDAATSGQIRNLIKSGDVSGRLGRCAVLTRVPGVKAKRVAVVGLGKPDAFGPTQFKKAVAAATSAIADTKTQQILNCLTLESVAGAVPYYLARHTVETIGDTLYRFTEMKSGRKKPVMPLQNIGLAIAKQSEAGKAMQGAKHGDAIQIGDIDGPRI